MTSGASATNSAAYLRMSLDNRPRPSESRSARCDRRSSPIAAAPARNRDTSLPFRIVIGGKYMSTPMRRIRSPCCARATIGHAAAPPRSVMNSRRLMCSLRLRVTPYHRS